MKRTRENGSVVAMIILTIFMGVVTSARDWHFLFYSPGEILQASKAPFSIEFTEESLDENSGEYKKLCKDVRKVLGIVIGLLKDRACVEEESDRKRARIDGYRSKK